MCAVGAVLRGQPFFKSVVLDSTSEFDSLCEGLTEYNYSSSDDFEAELQAENFLGALSIFFEQTWDEEYGKVAGHSAQFDRMMRETLIGFVEAHFPESFTVEL